MMIDVRPLSPALAALAEKELNETPERLVGDLKALKEWIKQSPHLRVRLDDQFLVILMNVKSSQFGFFHSIRR